MTSAACQPNTLVLYKNAPARVLRADDRRLTLQRTDGSTVQVRPKDVLLLHPGPIEALPEAPPPDESALREAWELLQGQTVPLADLAELLFGAFTPESAWATWQAVADGLYFTGTPEAVQARPAKAVEAERQARARREARARAWTDFLDRARRDAVDPQTDLPFLQEVIALARGQSERSRVLQHLGHKETPQNAHRLLLQWGVWSPRENPYPARLGIVMQAPDQPLPDLPDEPRRDLTHLTAWAIDDEGSRDPDDALSLEGDRLWVHVADVAALVPPESPADREARARGASVYLPEAIIPMLPEAARERLGLGLQPISPALSFGITLDPTGEIREVEIVPSWVRVTRMTYEEAEAALETDPTLQALHEITQRFTALRQARGAVDLTLPEVKVIVEPDGSIRFKPILPLRSRLMVREAMLIAGEAVARYALEHHIPLPFTTQDPPLEAPDDLPPGLAGMFARRKTLRRSQYSSTPAPHHGLGLPLYAQATSPLRRYLDLVVHQQLRAALHGDALLDAQAVLERVGMAEAVAGSIRQAERLSRRHWTLVYLLENPGWTGQGVLVEKRPPQGTVILPDLGLTASIYLEQDWPLNTELQLRVEEIVLPDLEVTFRVLGPA